MWEIPTRRTGKLEYLENPQANHRLIRMDYVRNLIISCNPPPQKKPPPEHCWLEIKSLR